MMKESRTYLSILNMKVNTLFNIVILLLRFFSRKVFIEYLGMEVIGLNSTVYNILEFLNFAELGIVSGVRFMLYKPYHDGDYTAINEIITLQGYIYKRISLVILALALVLMCLFPWIFAKMNLPLWYAYASFVVLLYSYMAGNFVNYRQVMFHVTQHTYRLNYYVVGLSITKICFQMFTLWYFSYGYVWWLLSELIFTSLQCWVVYTVTQRYYPFLRKAEMPFRELLKKYRILVVKVKQLFFHRIGAIVLTRTTPVIIYAFISLTEVALYGNYKMIVQGISVLSTTSFGSIAAGVGDLVAENDRKKSLRVFHEIFVVRLLMTAILGAAFVWLSSPFIFLWLGEEYVLGKTTVALIVAGMALNMVRLPMDMYIQASGMFQDTWAPIAETVINLGCAVVGGFLWGLNGILGGSIAGTLLIVALWKPYFLFREGFGSSCRLLWIQFAKASGCTVAGVMITTALMRLIPLDPYSGWWEFLAYSLLSCGGFSMVICLLVYLVDKSFRQFVSRFL